MTRISISRWTASVGAFGTTGQRCTATRPADPARQDPRPIRADARRPRRQAAASVPVSNAKTDVGPLIHEEARQKVAEYVDIAKEGRRERRARRADSASDKRLECGWFYEPTVLTGVKPGMRVEQEEIFGPVLAVLTAKDLTEAIRIKQ